jgi:Rrf2 family protein
MMITAKCKYGLKAMTYIARHGTNGRVLIADIAEAENIPKKFLDVILLELKTSGMLASKKGKGGGYQLAKAASRITIAEVVSALDGPLGPLPCAGDEGRACDDCRGAHTCMIHSVMTQVHDAMASVLENTTVSDLLRGTAEQPNRILMFDI